MDISSKDFSRAKFRLSQSRKRSHGKASPGRGCTQQRDSHAPEKQKTAMQISGSALECVDEVDSRRTSDRVDLQAMLKGAWATHSASSGHRHSAMMTSLLQVECADAGSIDSTVV